MAQHHSSGVLSARRLFAAAFGVLANALCMSNAHADELENLQRRTSDVGAGGDRPPPPTEAEASVAPSVVRATPARDFELMAPLMDDGRPVGMVRTRVSPDNAVSVRLEDVTKVAGRILDPTALARLSAQSGGDGWVSMDEAKAAGFELGFDPGLVEVSLEIPTDARGVRRFSVFPSIDDLDRAYEDPALFGIALNYRAALDYVHTSTNDRTGFRGLVSDIDIAGALGDVAFEVDAFLDTDSDRMLRRDRSRLIYDQSEQMLRWTAGDLALSSVGFQARPGIGGVSVSKLLQTFEPSRLTRSRGQQAFSLQRPSDVDIKINGRTVRRVRLLPGNYDARDFPFSSGANQVEIVIEDATGYRETLRFDQFVDRSLLAPGLSEYEAAVGVTTEFTADGADYQTDNPAFTGFIRRGMTDRLTAGANLQVDSHAVQGGIEGVYAAGGLGLLASDVGVSHSESGGSGYAARVDYQWAGVTTFNRFFGVSAETVSRRFGGIGGGDFENPFSLQLAARYGQRLSRSTSFSAQARYTRSRTSEGDSFGAGTSFAWAISDRMQLGVDVLYDRQGGKDEVGAFFTLSRRIGDTQDVRASYDTRSQRAQLGYSRTEGSGIGAWSAAASVDRIPNQTTDGASYAFSGQGSYVTARADVGAAHTVSYDAESGEIAQQRSSVRMAGAAAFSDGRFAIGRPLGDSFAILTRHETLKDSQIRVGAVEEGQELARSGLFGPALVDAGTPYNPNVIVYDVTNPPEGYDLGRASFDVKPRLHASYHLMVGSDYNMTIIGDLIGPDGKPLALQTGEVVSLDDAKAPRIEIFTNREGRFGASGIGPGRWRILILTGDRPAYDLIVRRQETNIIRVGALSPVQLVPNGSVP